MKYNVGVLLGELRKHSILLDSHRFNSENKPVICDVSMFLSFLIKLNSNIIFNNAYIYIFAYMLLGKKHGIGYTENLLFMLIFFPDA